jgi:hypothetical protein
MIDGYVSDRLLIANAEYRVRTMSPLRSQTVLLVDGYNIIGLWSNLRQTRDRCGLEAARRDLTEILVNYSAFRGFETRVVFDAHYCQTPSHREQITERLLLHYTKFGQTADTYIEKTCASFRRQATRKDRLIVATSDRAQQLTAVGYGAEWMSAEQLAGEVKASRRSTRRKQSRAPTRSSGRFLSNSLDPVAKQRLAQMRLGL